MQKFHSHQEVVINSMAKGMIDDLRGRLKWFEEEITHLGEYPDNYDVKEGELRLRLKMEQIDNAIRNLEVL